MNNILILREGIESDQPRLDWIRANLVIFIKKDGSVELLKNRNGSNGLTGKCGEIFDTNIFLEDRKFENSRLNEDFLN